MRMCPYMRMHGYTSCNGTGRWKFPIRKLNDLVALPKRPAAGRQRGQHKHRSRRTTSTEAVAQAPLPPDEHKAVRWEGGDRRKTSTFQKSFVVLVVQAQRPKVLRAGQFFTIFMWNRALATVSCTFCRSHLAKVLRALSFLRFYVTNHLMMMMLWLTYEIELWLQSHAHFANLIFQKWSKHDIFLFFMWNRALAAVLRAFCRPHLPKASRPLSSFTVTFFNWKSSSRYSSVHCLLTTFPDRSANHARKQRPLLRRPRQPLYPKKHRVSRPREFSSLNSLVPDLLDFPTTWWWCICHDDVVDRMIDMMMWLPQWWESWPWQSSVTRKFPN